MENSIESPSLLPRPTRRGLSRLWPRRLSVQLVLLFSLLLAGSMTAFSYRALQEEVGHIISTMKLQASVLANNVSATGANFLLQRDYTAIEQMLLRVIDFPGIVAIQICDAKGKLVGDVSRQLGQPPEVHYGQPPLVVPKNPAPSISFGKHEMVIWQPVLLGDLLGWTRITYSLQDIADAEKRFWYTNGLVGIAIILLALVLLRWLLRRPLASIERYTEFAGRLDEMGGGQTRVNQHSLELKGLGDALNRASTRLFEQNRAIRRAMEELERLASFPEKNPDIVLSMGANAEVAYLNPHGVQMLAELGLEREQIGMLLPANYREILRRCVGTGTTERAVEVEFHGRTVLWTFAPVQNQQIIHCYAHEITEKKLAEEQARAALVQKHAADAANQAKSAFLANMSHEIRTPLTAIIGFSESLLDRNTSMSERVEAVNTVIRAGKHLLQLINDILDLSKVEAGKLVIERVDVPVFPLMEDIKALAGAQALAKGIRFDVEYCYPLPVRIHSDPVRLRQIILNLVNNAIKFTADGSVTVRVRCIRESRKLQIEVVDTGVGLTPRQMSILFQPFSQADSSTTRQYGGTGLGLYLSRLLAEMLDGDISVESAAGRGSTFTCKLDTGPLDHVEFVTSVPVLPREVLQETVSPSLKGNVLLVEDNEDNQRLISFYLRKLGASVTVAENGAVGVGKAQEAPYDLVLMDMQMPVMDGLEATRLLREGGYKGPILALTANAMQTDIERYISAGCNGYLSKPIDLEQFNKEVSSHLRSGAAGMSEDAPIVSTLLASDPELIDLVEYFVGRLPAMIDELAHAVEERVWDTVKAKAHELKGVGGNYGFPSVSKVAAQIEFELAKKALGDIPQLIVELQMLQQRIQKGLTGGQ